MTNKPFNYTLNWSAFLSRVIKIRNLLAKEVEYPNISLHQEKLLSSKYLKETLIWSTALANITRSTNKLSWSTTTDFRTFNNQKIKQVNPKYKVLGLPRVLTQEMVKLDLKYYSMDYKLITLQLIIKWLFKVKKIFASWKSSLYFN